MKTFAKILFNLSLMLAIVVALGIAAFYWMDSWTSHGIDTKVPDVKGLSFAEASELLRKEGLTIELSDSVYDNKKAPGTVVDQTPRGNTKVKPGRVIYVTINAFSPRQVTLPQLTDISLRQAQARLKSIGIKPENVDTVKVFCPNKDLLVLSVKCDGRPVNPGARVSINSRITLEVGDGYPEPLMDIDSIPASSTDGTTDEFELLDLN